jgi:large subunit ribosomal protein L35
MPKMKTHKGAKRRFKITGTGKVLQAKEGRGLKRNRSRRSQQLWGKMLPTARANRKKFEVALPYGIK